MENPVPVTVACEIESGEPPVFVRVSGVLVLLPTCTLPNAMLAGLALRVPAATPTPLRARTVLVSVPLRCAPRTPLCRFWPLMTVVNEMLPLKFPTPVGAKVTLKEAVPPGCKVSGSDRLLIVKLAPLREACEMLTSVAPPLDIVTVLVLLVPTFMFPKFTTYGLRLS